MRYLNGTLQIQYFPLKTWWTVFIFECVCPAVGCHAFTASEDGEGACRFAEGVVLTLVSAEKRKETAGERGDKS